MYLEEGRVVKVVWDVGSDDELNAWVERVGEADGMLSHLSDHTAQMNVGFDNVLAWEVQKDGVEHVLLRACVCERYLRGNTYRNWIFLIIEIILNAYKIY